MAKKFQIFCRRTSQICIEATAISFILLALAIAVLVIRLKAGPVNIDFAKPYVQSYLQEHRPGFELQIDNVRLHWPDLKGPVLVKLANGALSKNQETVVSFDKIALGVSAAHLLIGQVRPLTVILERPDVQITRLENGQISIGFGNIDMTGAPLSDGVEDSLTKRIQDMFSGVGMNGAGQLLASLKSFQIASAQITYEDKTDNSRLFVPDVDLMLKTKKPDISLNFSVDVASGNFSGDFLISQETGEVNAQLNVHDILLQDFSDKFPALTDQINFDMPLSGRAQAVLDENFMPRTAEFEISSGGGSFQTDQWLERPVAYKNFFLSGTYDEGLKRLALQEGKIFLEDVPVGLEGDFIINDYEMNGPFRLFIPQVKQEKIAALWPKALENDNSKEWVVDKLSEGFFADAYATGFLRVLKRGEDWLGDVENIVAGFSFDEMRIDYRPPMIPVTNGKGQGSFFLYEERLNITVEGGDLDAIAVEEGRLEFTNIVEEGAGQADINLKINGPLADVFAYVEKDPINLNHGFDLTQVSGQAQLAVNVQFPTTSPIQKESVKIDVVGEVAQALLPDVVGSLDLTGGPYKVEIGDNKAVVHGSGALDGRPVTLTYQAFLDSAKESYESRVEASLSADENMRNKLGIDLSDFMSGTAPVTVTYTEYKNNRDVADIAVDLTPALVFFDPFDYEKASGLQARANLRAHLRNGTLQTVEKLSVTGPNLSLENAQLSFASNSNEVELTGGLIGRLVVGETVGRLEFESGQNGATKILLEGPFLDLRPFLDDETEEQANKPYRNPPLMISVAVDQMRTSDNDTVQYGKIYADIDGQGRFNQLELDAIAGNGDIYMRYKPDEKGMRVFRFEADDAGAALKAFDVYDQIIGGKLVIYAEPINNVYDRNLIGVAEMTSFRVVNAPVLARLLNAMSLPGLLGLLGDEGINFEKMEAKFDWLFRSEGSLLVLQEGRTSGSSLGFTFDGTFDNAADTIDVSGTAVPLSGINQMIGSIPLIGDLLTGGSGGVFAATYKIRGQGHDPQVSVNPLSVLAPGILRRILFE